MSYEGKTVTLSHELNSLVARSAAVIGLFGVSLIHLMDAQSKFDETPYMFWMYLALIGTSILIAGVLIDRDWDLAWLAAGALPAMAMGGFIASRTTGLPGAMGDIGNWTEPLGLASLLLEGCLVLLATYRLGILARRQ
jgi:hypothetical protein